MTAFEWGLGLMILFFVLLLGVGIYAMITESHDDESAYAQQLHLKHFHQINQGR